MIKKETFEQRLTCLLLLIELAKHFDGKLAKKWVTTLKSHVLVDHALCYLSEAASACLLLREGEMLQSSMGVQAFVALQSMLACPVMWERPSGQNRCTMCLVRSPITGHAQTCEAPWVCHPRWMIYVPSRKLSDPR